METQIYIPIQVDITYDDITYEDITYEKVINDLNGLIEKHNSLMENKANNTVDNIKGYERYTILEYRRSIQCSIETIYRDIRGLMKYIEKSFKKEFNINDIDEISSIE